MNLLKEGIEKGYVKKTDLKRKLRIDGQTENYTVYKVKLDYLYFNDRNDRIATWMSQYKSDNNIDSIDLTDIKKYNSIIHEFIKKSNPQALKNTQANIELVNQLQPGVCLSDGRIIDGNRRFTCLRNLARVNDQFNYFETVILNKDYENHEKEIKKLELMIQHGEESRVDYNPIDRLVGIYNDIIESKLLTVEEYRLNANITETKLKGYVERAKLLVDFLEFINAPKQFYIAREMDLDGPLKEIYDTIRKINNEDKKDEMKNILFANLLVNQSGDKTRFMRQAKKIANSNFLQEYIDESIELAEIVVDRISEVDKVNMETISNIVSKVEKTKDMLTRSLEKHELKAKKTETRNKPINILEKAYDLIDTIDINIFEKLNEEQLSNIISQINQLEEILSVVREATNV